MHRDNQALKAPFAGAQQFGTVSLLTGITNTILNLSQTFTYGTNESGELVKATTPLGAELEWEYAPFTYAAQGMTLREVSKRWLRSVPGWPRWEYVLGYDAGDGARQHHWYRSVTDTASNLMRLYLFQPDMASPYFGLVHEQNEHVAGTWELKAQTAYVWATSASGQPYIVEAQEKLDPGTANEKIAIRNQVVDQYGNLTQQTVKDWAAAGQHGAAFRDYRWTYLSDQAYVDGYIRNRVLTEQAVVGGVLKTLRSYTYDQYSGGNPCWAGGFGMGIVDRGSWIVEHDNGYNGSYTLRGNATRVDTLGSPSVCRKFDSLGNLVSQVNSAGQTLDLEWQSQSAYALPTKITPNGNAALERSMAYNALFDLTQVKSPNAVQQDFSYDTQHRPTTAEMETGATVSYTYSADGRVTTATVNGKFTRTMTDGLGRTTWVEKGHGSTVVSIVESEYAPCACSPVGKLKRVSRPHAPGQPPVWTTYTWDALGRTTRVDAPGGQFTTYEYAGNTVKVTDAGGKWKTYTLDAAGNIVKVTEPNPGGGTWDMLYTYNGLNQLTEARMTRGAAAQVRTWVYDGNQKLVSETLPESGTRTFGYDSAGRLAWKKDAKNQKVAYEYDSYDRLTVVKRYPVDGGAEDAVQRVTLVYDGTTGNTKGRLKDVHYGYGFSESFTYTNAGLPLTKSLAWTSTSGAGFLTLTAEYDNEGRRTSLRYPAHYTLVSGVFTANQGRKLIYGFDAAGRLGSVNQETGGALVSAINYNAASQVTSWTRAWGGNPNATETFTYNDAGQLTRQTLTDPAALVDVEYRYFSSNDGRLWQRKNWVSGEEVTYQYDSLGRLSAAATTSAAWGLSWTYDGFGNRLQQTVTKGQAPVHSVAVDPATNRMAGQSYDANGNMLIAGLVYDVENRMMTDGVWWYRYSWSNQRAVVLSAAETYAWFYGFGGELLGVYKLEKENGDANRTWPVLQTEKERVYALGRLMRMGSGDVVVDRGASVIRHGGQNLAYYPYGEEQVTSANDRAKYATYTRDASTGLDYAWNRMYKVEWGRFTTPDPSATGSGKQPSSWNKYAYVEGDPSNFHDPEGLQLRRPGYNWENCGENWLWDASLSGPCRDEGWPGGGGGAIIEFLPKPKPEPSPGPSLGGVIPALPILLPIIVPAPADDWEELEDRECEIQLKYRDVNNVPGKSNHALLAVIGQDGFWRYLEGQPTLAWSAALVQLTAESGQIFKGDHQARASQSGETLRGRWSVCRRVDDLFAAANKYNENKVGYGGYEGPNSNSLIRYLLSITNSSGIFPQPPDTPGWGTLIHGK